MEHSHNSHDRSATYSKNSLTVVGAVSMGTGVMIGAGILALTGQIAELAGSLFPLVFLAAFCKCCERARIVPSLQSPASNVGLRPRYSRVQLLQLHSLLALTRQATVHR